MSVDAYTQAHDAVVDALRQVDAAWRLRQEIRSCCGKHLDNFHAASKSFAQAAAQLDNASQGP